MSDPVLLTQLVWLHPGKESLFEKFEDAMIPLMERHGGELLMRERPSRESLVGAAVDPPDEIHVLRFASEAASKAYADDPERARLLPLKEESVRASLLVRGAVV